jgi:hypothetical protein
LKHQKFGRGKCDDTEVRRLENIASATRSPSHFFYFIIIEMSTSTEDERKPSTLDTEATDSSQSGSFDAAALVPSGLPGETSVVILNLITSNEAYHPIRWPVWKRWTIIIIYCVLQVFVCLPGTAYISIEPLIQQKWGGSVQVVTLGQSLFILGTAVGPVFLGPLS